MSIPPKDRNDFEIAVICALPTEADAVEALFDKYWDEDGDMFGKAPGDTNAYTTGVVGRYNVVLAHMPGIGKSNAASVASSFRSSYGGIKLALVVGICGGVPQGPQWTDDEGEILLGDIIISESLIQYDLGRQLPDKFMRKDTLMDALGRPNTEIRSFLAKLKGTRGHEALEKQTYKYLQGLCQKSGFAKSQYLGPLEDRLYKPTYRHKHHDMLTCTICAKCEGKADGVCDSALQSSCLDLKCDDAHLVPRRRLESTEVGEAPNRHQPVIHFGLIASGDQVMKSGEHRDEIAIKERVIAFETEGAGVWDKMPCVVIKGVCDYADSHKNKRWQHYAAATAASCMKAFLKMWVSADRPSLVEANSVSTSGHWTVPFGQNNQFIGRDSELNEVISKLDPNNNRDCQRVAIAGLGGIGKTQIALEAAFRIRAAHPDCSVFWVPAMDITTFEQAYREIGEKLQVPGIKEANADTKSLVKHALSKEDAGRWLMVIDNADDVELLYGDKLDENGNGNGSSRLMDYLPFSLKGSLLFTTRDLKAAVRQAEIHRVNLNEMSERDSLELLHTSLSEKTRENLQKDSVAAKKLLGTLAYLPLAMKQAAAFIEENTLSISDYLEMVEDGDEQFIELLSEDFEDKGRYRTQSTVNPIASTWLISFKQIQRNDLLAAEYLSFIPCLAQEAIPDSLLPPAPKLRKMKAIGTLIAYAFITPREGQRSYSIHRLVQIAMRNWLGEMNQLGKWRDRTLQEVSKVFPFPSHENRDIWTSYLPHADYLLVSQSDKNVFQSDENRDACLELSYVVGACLHQMGKYAEAEKMFQQILELGKVIYEPDHPLILAAMGEIGFVLVLRKCFTEAEQILKQKLERINNIQGDTLDCMAVLATVFLKQGKFMKAEQLLKELLESYTKKFGINHRATFPSRGLLALAFMGRGKYIEAEQLTTQATELKKRVLGVNHPSTLRTMSNLAYVFLNQNRHTEAEELFKEILKGRKLVLGVDHPDTLNSMYNLVIVLQHQRNYIEAEPLCRELFELRKRVLGVDHIDTLKAMYLFALILSVLERYTESEQLFKKVVDLYRTVLDIDHPNTLVAMRGLKFVLLSQSKFIEGERLGREILESRKRVYGVDHPITLKSMGDLVVLLEAQDKFIEAEKLLREIIESSKRVFGVDHSSTLETMGHLESVLKAQGKELLQPQRPTSPSTYPLQTNEARRHFS